jgi:hypothetical protein
MKKGGGDKILILDYLLFQNIALQKMFRMPQIKSWLFILKNY